MTRLRVTTRSADETLRLGAALGLLLEAGDVVALSGPLGAGKTVLVKGLASGLGVEAEAVTSPTFTLVHQYRGRLTLFHIDAYRLRGAQDMDALGADEILFGDGATVIEWADRVSGILPDERLDVQAEHVNDHSRTFIFRAIGPRYALIVGKLRKQWRAELEIRNSKSE